MAILHFPIHIFQRSKGRSAVAGAAYRSGTKLTNEWDGQTHDFTKKRGIVHAEIMLPAHAPPEFSDRSALWNSVEMIEKAKDSQLAREIEAALPVELTREQQLALVRSFVKDNFVDSGMCADFALHDKGDGNPHAHIMLTMRPLKENGEWGAKCRKVYDLDAQGHRIQDGKGGWKNHREDTTDWNDKDRAETWRAAWAACTNRALEAAGRPERIDHRSYQRQGIEKIPTVHMGVAATQMERSGIVTQKGDLNRQIAADNKLLKEIKARITRLYNWSKEEAVKPEGAFPSIVRIWEVRQETGSPASREGKVERLRENVALVNLLGENGMTTMQQFYEKVAAMNKDYYALRGEIVSTERRIAVLSEHLSMWEQYQEHRAVCKKYTKVKPGKRELFTERHQAELALYGAAERYLEKLKSGGGEVTPKAWREELSVLEAKKESGYRKMKEMREQVKAVEALKKAADKLAKEQPGQGRKKEGQEL